MAKLNEQDRQRLIELLEKGEDLPLDYKHILFPPEKKEYELVYACKQREEDILADTMAVPLQPIKTFGENRGGWKNKLIFGDNLQVMKSLLDDPEVKGRVKLIYIDPPFATQQEFKGSQDQKAYQDKILGTYFIEFLRKRLIFLSELLAEDGIIYVHLDYRVGHYIKVILDELFQQQNFRNEISVRRKVKNLQNQFEEVRRLNIAFDSVFWYSKTSHTRFEPGRRNVAPREDDQWNNFFNNADRPTLRYPLLGINLTHGQWRWKKERAEKAVENYKEYVKKWADQISLYEYWVMTGKKKNFIKREEGSTRCYYWVQPKETRPVDTNWFDIYAYDNSPGSYPTQKSEELLYRIIKYSSEKDDLVLDAFTGSGTTLAVAEKLGRRWIGIDCGKLAIYTIQKRLLNLKNEIGNKGKRLKPKPFTLYHAGLYDFSKLKQLPWEEWRKFALLLFNCRDEKHIISGIELDGYRKRSDVLVFDYQKEGGVVLDYGFIDDLHSMIGSKVGRQVFIIAPAASVMFLEDYINKGSVRYYILRIPYSIINELHNRDFEAIKQPIDESQVNNTVDAVGFDFIRQPKVECTYATEKPKGGLLEYASVKMKTFKSEAMLKGASQLLNRESLSLIMVDFDYNGKTFNLDKVYYANKIEENGWKMFLPIEDIKDKMMIIYLDIYGNEYREIKTLEDFSASKRGKRGGK